MNELQLIALYYHICDYYDSELRWVCQRFSNNSTQPAFTDEELLTIYLYVMIEEEKYKIKSIWRYAQKHLKSWFPNLPSYQAFNVRLNRLAEALPVLVEHFLARSQQDCPIPAISLMDSYPIILCSSKRKAKVAKSLSNKGYCAAKKMHYYGVKLHVVAMPRPGTLPVPEYMGLTPASVHDLTALRPLLPELRGKALFGDKIYADKPLNEHLQREQDTYIYTPVKLIKEQTEMERQRNKAADDLFSRAVSATRQPIESFFNWVHEKTQIQFASKVRSKAGLLVHVFGRLAAACYLLAFYP
jgi:hypothetical protein